MKATSYRFLLSTVCVAALLGGCGSSSSTSTPDNEIQDDPTGAGTGTEPDSDSGPDTGTDSDPYAGAEPDLDTGADSGPDTDAGPEPDTDAGPDPDTDAGPEPDPDTGAEPEPEPDSDTGAEPGPDTDAGPGPDTIPDTGAEPGPDNTEGPDLSTPPDSGLEILVPNVVAGSDLERLIAGIKRQVSLTLLDLNQRLAGGVQLTDQQENCLGTYDPSVGQQLLVIDCDQALATGDVTNTVSVAAFYDTEECHASIFSGNTDNCQLQRAGMATPDLFRVPEGERRPTLIYAGSNISYAVNDTLLHIENSESALAGSFSCDIDLSSGNSTTALDGSSCASVIAARADHLDEELPPQ